MGAEAYTWCYGGQQGRSTCGWHEFHVRTLLEVIFTLLAIFQCVVQGPGVMLAK